MRRLIWAFAVRICPKTRHRMAWLILVKVVVRKSCSFYTQFSGQFSQDDVGGLYYMIVAVLGGLVYYFLHGGGTFIYHARLNCDWVYFINSAPQL